MRLVAATAAMLMTAGAAAAAEGWSFRLTPQAWAPSFDAQVDIADRRAAETDVAVFDDLEAVPSVEAEIRFRRFGLLAEWTDLDIGEDARTDRGGLAATVDLDGTLATFLASWRFAERPRWSAEALAGGRYVSLDAEVDVAVARTTGTEQSWGDPLVGLRGAVALSERVTVEGRAQLGGFGIGSDVTWEARGRLAVALREHVALAAGWRHLDVEYEKGDIAIDFALIGPFLAVDFVF